MDDGSDLGLHLARLFDILNTPPEKRQKNLEETLDVIPYVNGALFEENLGFADFNRDMRNALLAATRFDWSRISPAVFGSLFQAVMVPRERRQIGGHYTSERDILKVIRALFLDDLQEEFRKIGKHKAELRRFQQKIAKLRFLDPACGCGNFLVISYRELRQLEIEILKELHGSEQQELDIQHLSLIDVDAFYGIEIGEWPARIAEVAMWLMDHQMNIRLSEAFGQYFVRLPLRKSPTIVCGNALRLDWKQILPPEQCSYVLGNPPFVGKKEQNPERKADMALVFEDVKGAGVLDYVSAWYLKASQYIAGTTMRVAFVSTNSITEGEQVGILWRELLGRFHVIIHFAHRTFAWESEAKGKAHVHVVIIGFAEFDTPIKVLFEYDELKAAPHAAPASNINPYLVDAIVIDPQGQSVVAVLGGEGVGKTWLMAQWWAKLREQPIMILVAGRRANVLDPAEPLESLARLLAQQDGRLGDAAVAAWRRRLSRWKGYCAEGHLRFVVVLDGLNEHAGKPWADILNSLVPEVHALGGLVIATSREAFWHREIDPRIRNILTVRTVSVTEYTDEELADKLSSAGAMPGDLQIRVREFVRNPRVCAVAMYLLNRLSLQPNELTVERLLLEYWHWRVEERGDLVGHSPQDFERLLRSHAHDWLTHPDRTFDRDNWTFHSGAMRRGEGRNLFNDLTEIEEGRFMRVAPDYSGAYEFRQETLPFALALLVNHELKSGLIVPGNAADELLDGILDSVRGFDLIAKVVAAATGMACIENSFPLAGRRALILAWLGLQNVSDETFITMAAYVPERPGAFFDVAELSNRSIGGTDRPVSLISLFSLKRDHPRVVPELQARLIHWLGRWSRQAQFVAQGDKQAQLQSVREARIDDALRALFSDERRVFNQVCIEVTESAAMHLDRAAAILMAVRAQEHLAPGLVGWAFAQVIAGDNHNAGRELAWVVRLNPIDHAETEAAVRRMIEPITSGASEPARRAAAIALNLLGTRSAAVLADKLIIRGRSNRWRLVDDFCDTNPYDPTALPGSNLDKAREKAAQVSVLQVWNQMCDNSVDHHLKLVTPALTRFDPTLIVIILREIVRSIEHRTQLPFRQLAIYLPELSPLFDEATLDAVQAAYRRLISEPNIVRDKDFCGMVNQFVYATTPHLDGEAQLDLLLSLPPAVPDLRRELKSISPESLERRLEAAFALSDTSNLRRILFFIAESRAILTDRMRQIIAEQIDSCEEIIAIAASVVVFKVKDHDLNTMILEQAQRTGSIADISSAEFGRARAVAEAVIEQRRGDLLNLVAPRFLRKVVIALGDRPLVVDYVELVLKRLLQPVVTHAPHSARLIEAVSEDEFDTTARIEVCNEIFSETVPLSRLREFSNPEVDILRFEEHQEELSAFAEAFETELANAGALELALAPPLSGIADIAKHDPSRVALWLELILKTTENWALSQIHNLGVAIAGAYATNDPGMAAAVLRHLHKHPPPVNIVLGEGHVSLDNRVLFSSSDVVALDPLREGVFEDAYDDAQLEEVVAAAEACGAMSWLDRYMDGLLGSAHPGNQARGLTIAGLRLVNVNSDRGLAESWGTGFLGEVAAAAAKNYQHNRWALHWFVLAQTSSDRIDFWRFGKLAEGVADRRFVGWFNTEKDCDPLATFGDELYARFRKAAQKCTEERKKTLFGLKAPDRDLLVMLRDDPAP